MPLTADDTVQENSGTGNTTGTSFVATLPAGTTAGNTVLIFVGIATLGVASTGFTLDKSVGTAAYVLRKPDVTAAETSWTVTFTNASAIDTGYSWYVVEESNLDLVDPLDVSAASTLAAVANGGTLSTGTTPQNAGLDTVAFAVYGVQNAASTTVAWSGYTNGFEEVADLSPALGSGSLAVARRFPGSTGTFSSTATLATTASSPNAGALIVVYRSATSPIVAPLAMFAGFDWGTHGGINAAGGVASMMGTTLTQTGTWGTNYLIQAGSARNSNYGLRIVQSATAAAVRVGELGASVRAASVGLDVRVVSGTGTVVVAEVTDQFSSSVFAQIVYDTSATKFGVRAGSTGTVSWETGTTALSTWRWIDLRAKVSSTTWHADWRIETGTNTYTDQAAAELTGQAVTTINSFGLGRNASQTMTADYDNVVVSRYYSAFPLGPHEVKLLTVDPAGTPSVSGTLSNFSVFTANTTLGAWNAANARNAVDEVPPTISASADGVTQTAVAASDYIELPMATYTTGPAETIVGVRMLAPLWSGTGAGAGDLAIRGWDGTTETALATASQITPGSATTASATVPVWRAAMWQSVNGWTQAELDAAAVRVGFSGDATPDMGVHAVYLEVAVGKARTQQLFGDLASVAVDPNRGGTVAVTVVAPAGYDTTLHYEESGTPTDVPVTGGASVTEQINAPFEADVNYIAAYPAAEPDPVD